MGLKKAQGDTKQDLRKRERKGITAFKVKIK